MKKYPKNFYRKEPRSRKQVIEARKQVKFDERFIDNNGVEAYFNRMYQDIDIYDNNIVILTNNY